MTEDEYDIPDPFVDDDDDERKRPQGVRFGDGQDTGLGGRPAGSLNRTTIIKRVAKRRHLMKIDGKTCTRDTLDLVLRAIRTNAALGKITAFDLQEQLKARFQADITNRKAAVFFCSGKLTTEEWSMVYGTKDLNAEAVTARFPHLSRIVKDQCEYIRRSKRDQLD